MKYGIYAKLLKLLVQQPTYNFLKHEVPSLITRAYKKRVDKEYRDIIERTEGIGGIKENPMELILVFTAFAIAVYKCSDGNMSEEVFAKTIDSVAHSKIMELSSKGSNVFSKKTIKMYQDLAKRSIEKRYKNDWAATFDYEEGSGEYFVTYSECGICKLAKQEDVFQLVKYMCKMDYPSFEFKNAVLDRTKTLGFEDDCCNFHIMSKEKADEVGFVMSEHAK